MRIHTTAVALGMLIAGAAHAEDARPIDRLLWGGAVQVGAPRGSFGDVADAGVGGTIHATVRTRGGALGWRTEAGWLVYGSDTQDRAFTENSIGHAVMGPVLMAPRGAVRPYASALAGVSYFETATELRPRRLGRAVVHDTRFDDTLFTYGAAAGVLVPFGRSGVSLDLGVRYGRNHDARYLAEGDLRTDPDGALSFQPRRGDADVLDFRIGVSVGR